MTETLIRRPGAVVSILAALLAGSPSPGSLEGQAQTPTARSMQVAAALGEETALDRGRYAVLVDLDENRLYFKQGEVTLWSAPVGTGTGIRLITESDDWDFSTPTGRFQVQYKERDPVWIAPDWYFVENNLPVPPQNHPSRYMRGTLGEAAVYISPHLAIHGTDRPELIGQRVSHGCIRLENRFARRLYHNVQVGTEVIIVGGDAVRENAKVVDFREGYDPILASRGRRSPPPADRVYEGWKRMSTERLLEELEAQLDADPKQSRWDDIAILLLNRAREDDEEALDALLEWSTRLPTVAIEREWATFLTDVYRRAPVRTLEALSRLDMRSRRATAEMIVAAAVTLYNGDLEARSVPWPTNRIGRDLVPVRARRGWDALAAAEREQRNRIRGETSQV